MFRFPKDLYADIRMVEYRTCEVYIWNDELRGDSEGKCTDALIRVFDGEMWYVAQVNDFARIQEEMDELAALATPNPGITDHPIVAKYEVHRDTVCYFDENEDPASLSTEQWKEALAGYLTACAPDGIPECSSYSVELFAGKRTKSFYSSKGAELIQHSRRCAMNISYGFQVEGVTTSGGKYYEECTLAALTGHEEEILACRERYLDFARNAKYIEPGEYTCVLAPEATALFTHEIFGHRSEADHILNDPVLQEEWKLGRRVGSEKVSIYDEGGHPHESPYLYDDEGTRTRRTWLITKGVLTGRLHDVKSAVAMGEELTGNARAVTNCMEQVRMMNTCMDAGEDDPEEIIRGVKDGIYLYNMDGGTGGETFTLRPDICYRIRDGKLCEPVRINLMTGSVYQALFDVDAVGTDLTWFNTFTCTKGGQTIAVGCGGPTIRIKKLTVS